MSDRPTVYEFVGGAPALDRFVDALHARCVADPLLEHPFTHAGLDPDHNAHLAAYLAEVFGGPTTYSQSHGGHSFMLDLHAGTGADDGYGDAFVACFLAATDDANLPTDESFRRVWRDFIVAATDEVLAYAPEGATPPADLAMPRWGWDGPIAHA